MSQRNGDGRLDATDGSGAGDGLSGNREILLSAESDGAAAAAAVTTRAVALTGTALATATELVAATTQTGGQVSRMTFVPKVKFPPVAGTAFDRWLARELRLMSAALAQPVPQKLRDLIEGHRKITK